MGQAIAVRTDFTAGEVRRFASGRRMPLRRADCWRSLRYSTALRGRMPPRSAG